MSTTSEGTADWVESKDSDAGGNSDTILTDLEEAADPPTAGSNSRRNKEEERPNTTNGDDDVGGQSHRPPFRGCRSIPLLFVSTIYLGLFVFFALFFTTVLVRGIEGVLFYSAHAAIAVFFIVYWTCFFPEKVLYRLTFAMAVWSIVGIIQASVKISKTEDDGSYDDSGWSELQDTKFHLVGACIGLTSTVWHGFMTRHCVKEEQ